MVYIFGFVTDLTEGFVIESRSFVIVGIQVSQVPSLLHSENVNSAMIVLRKEYAWHIGGLLPTHELVEWKLLYHSTVNGLSFTTFMGNIS